MRLLKLSTARNILVVMIDSADHIAGKTGLTLTITASKAGGAFSSISPTVTERTVGGYQLALTSAHTDTLGDLVLHITGTGADPQDVFCQVVTDLPGDTVASVTGAVGSVTGLTAATVHSDLDDIQSRLPAALTADGNIKADTLRVGGTLQTAGDIIGDTNDIQARIPAALVSGRIDASVGAMAANVMTAAAAAADLTTELQSGLATQASVDTIDDFLDTEIAAIKAKTDQLQFTNANKVDAAIVAVADLVDAVVAKIADGMLDRNMATGTDSGSPTVRTVRQALRVLRNKATIAGATLTVTKEDDTTASWTGAVTTTAGNPISEIDPASS